MMRKERRKIPRFLCADQFSDSLLLVGSNEFSLVSINFNRFGMGLYSNINIPNVMEQDDCLISFQLETETQNIIIKQLACKLANIRLTDVGHQYGITFAKQQNLTDKNSKLLQQIEKYLKNKNSPENRYGLF